ncbi:hypothetical protein KY290_012501 [Solanum tuberosum]|uniref:GAG-pre-integrase domain-containing protein n=1 Tax=Solanum tuberosum TaxID=4113 RepID=A0ABQ7W5M0_SOLTU|nr:hypothetical protein KY290_012501 [Solanum tuberosum]
MSPIVCHNCEGKGDIARVCPSPKNPNGTKISDLTFGQHRKLTYTELDLETKGILHTGPSIDGLYSLPVKKLLSPASFAAALGVWHTRLAHASYPIVRQALPAVVFTFSKSSSLCTECVISGPCSGCF